MSAGRCSKNWVRHHGETRIATMDGLKPVGNGIVNDGDHITRITAGGPMLIAEGGGGSLDGGSRSRRCQWKWIGGGRFSSGRH